MKPLKVTIDKYGYNIEFAYTNSFIPKNQLNKEYKVDYDGSMITRIDWVSRRVAGHMQDYTANTAKKAILKAIAKLHKEEQKERAKKARAEKRQEIRSLSSYMVWISEGADNGGIHINEKFSKIHLSMDGEKTLCGINPTDSPAFVEFCDSSNSHKNCKRCHK